MNMRTTNYGSLLFSNYAGIIFNSFDYLLFCQHNNQGLTKHILLYKLYGYENTCPFVVLNKYLQSINLVERLPLRLLLTLLSPADG